ncbi:unnamed protein product [Caenorhabditis auriculariae]|uniref:Uncharacterized protein n=1 Tax=Caenorhabditis auriculariae TaxID=2777116 RepID=A0A8S1GQ24_9PELO|nr:unnamed protein product [Caenorhabditis auriculariae]
MVRKKVGRRVRVTARLVMLPTGFLLNSSPQPPFFVSFPRLKLNSIFIYLNFFVMNSQSPSRLPTLPSTPTSSRHSQARTPRTRATAAAQRKSQSSSPSAICYASSQFCHSPSANTIPLPPTKWLSEVSRSPSFEERYPSLSSSPSPSLLKEEQQEKEHVVGIRVCPLQLIAAVASS